MTFGLCRYCGESVKRTDMGWVHLLTGRKPCVTTLASPFTDRTGAPVVVDTYNGEDDE